ncbi:tRNA 2-thiouridine(34) synthase MnmA [Nitrosomonas sp. JL21]|uniref:tRNA 2-thiouridine(34) synthase MnmA n=1 Tax=Nitrosomonas sp. JL21 TaxID=153949 RepID=UPI00136A78CD|nr:tRNA 2-thiouridine(34) synthase MnmA [Nitrosomonas sp. JL21]MBL8496394.1 tRNA 2-thiouridine(34) synthase MnmA [Nitrosomonas sp.]MXS77334.1 tRNA 2-thiouridine(34) synthase MnmA [Nitrosomonas sp. JL21]
MKNKRVVVGMSGGVDSSVAAYLLKQQGYDVVGLFMKNWEDDDTDEYCSSRQDFLDAVSVADVIDIPIEVVNFSTEYKDRVFSHFLAEYQAGRTPNPDVLCNAEIKFKAFLEHAHTLGADHIATGHYAQVRKVGDTFQLLKGEDGNKDQSYFLYRLNQAQLATTLFPVGHLYKRDVRRIAEELKLPNFSKKDSTGICFIGERPFREFLNRYLPHQPGEIQTPDGKVVGKHLGLMYYTIGQRQGLGIGGTREGSDEPWFVFGKDMARNVLIVVQGHDHPSLFQPALKAADLTWISGKQPHCNWVYAAKTRYRQVDAPCAIARFTEDYCEVDFAQDQWAVTPGQSVVIYESKVCLGGGVIVE